MVETLGGHSVPDAEVRRAFEAGGRLVYSLAAFVEIATGEKLDDACRRFYLPERVNPFAVIDAAAAIASGKA